MKTSMRAPPRKRDNKVTRRAQRGGLLSFLPTLPSGRECASDTLSVKAGFNQIVTKTTERVIYELDPKQSQGLTNHPTPLGSEDTENVA
jgi:hypothetical protein